MKIAVIGGAGVRTPLLVGGLTESDLPIEQIALYDVDQPRLAAIGAVAERMAAKGRVTLCESVAECVAWADVVFTSIRVGGIEQRIRDEAVAQRHGIVGQETVGPAGFAMAMRTIPPMVRYAREIAAAAPRAWIVNFTNPVGMVTEAMRTVSDRVIGICDTPTELFEDVARALGLASDELLLRLLRPESSRLAARGLQRRRAAAAPPVARSRSPAVGLQGAAVRLRRRCARLRLLPTEYVYYYDQPTRAFDNVRRAGRSRGQVIEELTRVLFEAPRRRRAPTWSRVYKSYLWTRSASYMQIEAGSDAPSAPAPATGLSGYDRIALGVLRAIHFNANTIIPLSVANRGNIARLRDGRCRRGAVRGERQRRPAASRRPGSRSHRAAADAREGVRAPDGAGRARRSRSTPPATRSRTIRWWPDAATADRLVDDLSPLW